VAEVAEDLRGGLIDQIGDWYRLLGMSLPREVDTAMRKVARHLFAPGIPLQQAYSLDSVITKKDAGGVPLSAVSAPAVVAMMLDQLQVLPGQRILEIGSGGYNAALLRELTGKDGSVTSIDIDQETVDRAAACLEAAGYSDVQVLCADGEFGATDHGPFDRIIVTVSAWDIPPAWSDQLASDGRLVVPLRFRGLSRSWAFEHADGHLASRAHGICGFVPMQGAGEHQARPIRLHGDDVNLFFDQAPPSEGGPLSGVLAGPREEAWSGVMVGKKERFDDQDLWLAAALPDFAVLTARQDAVDIGLVSPSWLMATPALADGNSVAYRAKLRPADAGQTRYEFGAYAHGPAAARAAGRLAEQIQIWDRDHRYGPGPRLTVHPAGTPDAGLPDGRVADKRHTRMVLSWSKQARVAPAPEKEGMES
jgi:protein-L-isoaspartate(D-aspartate) O-methyltransferase